MKKDKRKVKILFVHSTTTLGLFISAVTRGSCNHVALLIGDDVYSMETEGLRVFSKAEYYSHNFILDSRDINVKAYLAIEFLNKHSKIKYDWRRSGLWPFRNIIENTDEITRWNCVEMVYYTLRDQLITLWDGSNISPAKLMKIVFKR